MTPEKYTFKINGRQVKNLTMEEAIDRCRSLALDGMPTRLAVSCKSGKFIDLAEYNPVPPQLYKSYSANPKDPNCKDILKPQISVELFGRPL